MELKHYITKYRENDQLIVESWLQINFLKWNWCFSKRKLVIDERDFSISSRYIYHCDPKGHRGKKGMPNYMK